MLPNFNTGKTEITAYELQRAQELSSEKYALEMDSPAWDAFVDFNSPQSEEIRKLQEALEDYEHEYIFQNGIGSSKDPIYIEFRRLLKHL